MILGASNFTEALCYLDDILIWGKDWAEHLKRLETALGKVARAGISTLQTFKGAGGPDLGIFKIEFSIVHDRREPKLPDTFYRIKKY